MRKPKVKTLHECAERLIRASGDDPTRYMFGFIHVEAGQAVATDGTSLYSSKRMTLQDGNYDAETLSQTGRWLDPKEEINFPAWKTIVPKYKEDFKSVIVHVGESWITKKPLCLGLAPGSLSLTDGDVFFDASKLAILGPGSYRFTYRGTLEPIIITEVEQDADTDKAEWFMLLMPMRKAVKKCVE